MKDFTVNVWNEIPNTKSKVNGYERSKTMEQREKEKMKYWSWFYQNKVDRIKASSCVW